MDCEASQVAAVNQAQPGSARPTNSVTSRPLVRPQRTTERGMRKPFVIRRQNKDKALPKLQRKIRMALDENNSSGKILLSTFFAGRSTRQPKLEARKRGLQRHFETKLNIKEESVPELKKENMDLDDNRSSGKVKKGKTKEDAKDGRPHPHPGRKLHVVYLDDDAIEDAEANLAYHKKFLENVFGSRASEIIIVISFSGDCNRFAGWLTDEEVDILSGQDVVTWVKYASNYVTFEGRN